MANTGNGAKGAAKTANPATVGDSSSSVKAEKRNTRKTAQPSLSAEQALEILVESVNICRQAGLQAYVANFWEGSVTGVSLILPGVVFEDGRIKYPSLPSPEGEG